MVGKDSANEKRYARRGREGQGRGVEEAFGFTLALLLARSAEIEALAAQRLEKENSYGSRSSARPFADVTLPG